MLPTVNAVPLALLSTTLPVPLKPPMVGVAPLKFTVPMAAALLLTVTNAVEAMLPVEFNVAASALVPAMPVGFTVTLPAPKPPATAEVSVPALTVVPPV